MQLWQIYKDWYEHEVMIRNYYDGKIGQTFTILSATAGLIIYSMEHVKCISFLKQIYFALLLVSIIVFVVQMICLFKAYFSFKYKYQDFPVDLIEIDIKEQIHHMSNDGNFQERMYEYISGMLYRTYKICTETYFKTNISKRKYHHILNLATYINFIFLFVQYFIWFLEAH